MINNVTRRQTLGALCAGSLGWFSATQDPTETRPQQELSVRTTPLIEAHRGDSSRAPECTLPAIELAIKAGADRVEIDLRSTRDGQLVIMHDDTVDRTTNGRGRVADLDFATLRKLDAGAWFGQAYAGARIPTLREALDICKDRVMIDIDLKVADAVPAMVRDIKEAGMLDQVVMTGDIPGSVDAIRNLAPTITMFNEAGGVEQSITIARKHQLPGLCLPHEILNPAFIRQAHLHGLSVLAWTVDDADRIRTLAEWGVDAIMTNDPVKAIRAITGAGTARGR